MPGDIKNSASYRVKLLTLTSDEVEAAKQEAHAFYERVAPGVTEIAELEKQNGLILGQTLYTYPNSYDNSPPPIQKALQQIGTVIDSQGWDNETAAEAMRALGEKNEALLTSRLIGKALEDKIRIDQGSKETFDLWVDKEAGRHRLMLNAWTQAMAQEDSPFSAHQQFRDRSDFFERLYTSNTIFIPDTIGGYKPKLSNYDTSFGYIKDKYSFAFTFIDQTIKNEEGGAFRISSDLYIVDHRLLDSMVEHGGVEMRDSILRSYQTLAQFATHGYIHNSVDPYDVEIHALRSHKAVAETIFSNNPEVKATLFRQAVGFSDVLASWENAMIKDGVNPQEARDMTSVMARQYFERLNTFISFDDPELYLPLSAANSRTVAGAFGRFTSVSTPVASENIPSKVPDFKEFDIFRQEMQRNSSLQNKVHESYNVHSFSNISSEYEEVPIHHVTNEDKYRLAKFIRVTRKTMDEIHQQGQDPVMAQRAQKDAMKQTLRIEELIGEQGLIPHMQMQLALAGTEEEIIHNVDTASERLTAVIQRAERSIEVGGIGRGWRSESELPQAIKNVQAAIAPLEGNAHLASIQNELNDKLQQVRESWEEINTVARRGKEGKRG